jgi:adducin
LLAQMGKATRSGNKTRWVNSPNVYQKVEVLETGTTDPKKITKWVADGSPSHSTPVKIETSNQFVPMGSDPKEFRRVQKLMKEGRRLGGVHAGPESKVLDGLSWEEARQMADAQVSHVDGYGMKVGAASKGIIQRDFQHNATVYKSPYAKNPFDMVSNEELEEYKRIINNKGRGEMSPTSPHYDTMGDTTDAGEHTAYETDGDGNRTFSEGEGDTSRADDPDSVLSPKKEKKKKVLKTPSFLKKKKKDKKEKEKA